MSEGGGDRLEHRSDQMRGGLREYDDGRIVSGEHYLLIEEDGSFIGPVEQAMNAEKRAQNTLWRRISPLEFHGVEVTRATRLYHTEWEEHIRAKEIDLDEDGVPWITFLIVDSWPKRFVELSGADLSEMIGVGDLKDDEQIHEEVTAEMERLRSANVAQGGDRDV